MDQYDQYLDVLQVKVREWILRDEAVQLELDLLIEGTDPHVFGRLLANFAGGESRGSLGRVLYEANNAGRAEGDHAEDHPFFRMVQAQIDKDPFLTSQDFELDVDEGVYHRIGEAVFASPWWSRNVELVRAARSAHLAALEVHTS